MFSVITASKLNQTVLLTALNLFSLFATLQLHLLNAFAILIFEAFYASSGTQDGGPPSDDEPRLVARAMFPTKAHIVTVHSDGKVRWLAPQSFDIHRVVDLSSFNNSIETAATTDDLGLDGNMNSGTQWVVPVTSSISPGFLSIVVGTADGMVLSLPSGINDITDVEDFDIESFAEGGKYSSEGAAREWSTVVKISIPPPSFKPVLLFLTRSPLL